jgi:hypothetical protein
MLLSAFNEQFFLTKSIHLFGSSFNAPDLDFGQSFFVLSWDTNCPGHIGFSWFLQADIGIVF